jgi:hypothetical protein
MMTQQHFFGDRFGVMQVVTDIVHLNTQQKLDPYRGDYDTFEKTRMDRLKNQLRVLNLRSHTHFSFFLSSNRMCACA